MTWFRVGGAGIPATLKNAMNAVFNKKFGTSGQNYPPKQWPDDVNLLGPLPEGTATGSIANFSDGADRVPVKAWGVTLGASLTGYSEVNGVQAKKNLSNADKSQIIVRDKTIQCALKAGTYTMSFDFISTTAEPSPTYLQVSYATNDGTKYNPVTIPSSGKCTRTFTLAFDSPRFTIYASEKYASSVGVTTIIDNFMIEVGSAATAFEPYEAPTQYTVNLGRTIYGGSADLVTGEGVETHNIIDLSSLTFSRLTNAQGVSYFSATISDMANGVINVKSIECTKYNAIACINRTVVTATSFPDLSISQSSGGKTINIRDDSFADADAFMASLQVGDYLAYPLATPTDFTFDGQEINSLYGVNNFWNDAGGDTTVVYRRDIDLALQAVSSSRGLMMASRPVTQLIGEESDPDQVNELVENDETEQEGEDNAR